MLKFATFEVLSSVLVPENATKADLRRIAHRHSFDYEPRPGFLYVRSRAISSRCNDNFDEFPGDEIKQGFRSFIGKPVFVNHNNDNHRRARGVVIDAALHEDQNPDGSPDIWVEALMEVDAKNFPKLAEAIVKGEIARTSMGTDVAHSICSACGNKATTPAEYCAHIPRMKGQRIYRHTASGTKEGVLIREICYGLKFFENSLLVEPPADPTAYFLGVDTRGIDKAAAKQGAFGFEEKPGCEVCGDTDHESFTHDALCSGCGKMKRWNGEHYDVQSDRNATDEMAHQEYEKARGEAHNEVNEHMNSLPNINEQRRFLDSNPTGPTKYSSKTSNWTNWEDIPKIQTNEKCEECGKPKDHIHIPQHVQDEMRAAAEAGQMHADMADSAQKRVVNTKDQHDLKAHMMEAHGYDDDSDFWRTSHDEDHPALDHQGFDDEDRDLHPHEVQKLHDWEHGNGIKNENPDYLGGEPGHFMGDSHFHTAAKADVEEGPSVSGVVLKAADTGRILMLQRSLEDEKDPAAGTWEFPGGHHEDGDLTSLHAGIREWQEEVGQPFPEGGHVSHTWRSPNGVYQGHVVTIPEEKALTLHEGRSEENPDDPDGDDSEQVAWWDTKHAQDNPALRKEVKQSPWDEIHKAGSRKTASNDHDLLQFFANAEEKKLPGGYLNEESEANYHWAKPDGKAPYEPFEHHAGYGEKQEGHGPWHLTRHPETRAHQVVDNKNRLVDSFPGGDEDGSGGHSHAVSNWVAYNQDHGHIPKWQDRDGAEVESTGLNFRDHMGRGLVLPGTSNARRKGEALEDSSSVDTQHVEFHRPAPPFKHSTEDPQDEVYRQRAKDNPAPEVYPTKSITESSSREHGTTYKHINSDHPDYNKPGAFHTPSPDDEWHGPYTTIKHPDTGKYHVVDNQNRITHAGPREGMDDQGRAEERRDYIDKRMTSKEKAKGLAEHIFNSTMEIMDPGGTPESRESERNMQSASDLMKHYEPHHIKYDDNDEPYAHAQHPSGWQMRDYGGNNLHVYHAATGDTEHDLVHPQGGDDGSIFQPGHKREGFDHGELKKELNSWVGESGDDYARNTPEVSHWQRHGSRKRAISDEDFDALTTLPPLDLPGQQARSSCSNCGAPLANALEGSTGTCPNCEDGGGRKSRQRQKLVRTVSGLQAEAQSNPHWGLEGLEKIHSEYTGRKPGAPVMNNTKVWKDEDGNHHLRLHDTDVVSWNDNHVTLRSGGYHSNTTRHRINNAGSTLLKQTDENGRHTGYEHADRADIGVNQHQHNWYSNGHDFEDGISFDKHTGERVENHKVAPVGADPGTATGGRRSRSYEPSGPAYSGPSHAFTPRGEDHGGEPGADYSREHDQRVLRDAEHSQGHDSYGGDEHRTSYEGDDMPQEHESFDDWMNRTSPSVKAKSPIAKCPSCQGRGRTGPYGSKTNCRKCEGSGYLNQEGEAHHEPGFTAKKRLYAEAMSRHAVKKSTCTTCGLGIKFVSDGTSAISNWQHNVTDGAGLPHQARPESKAAAKLGFGEIKAPADVDTLRDEECPVCGETDSYDGTECQVCGFIAPPKMFQDPDLDVAKSIDLRQDEAMDQDQNAGMPDEVPGSEFAGTDETGDPNVDPGVVDPAQVGQDGSIAGPQVGDDPAVVDGEVRTLGDEGEPIDPTQVDADGNVVDPNLEQVDQDAATGHVNEGGEVFQQGPNSPQGPDGPDGPGGPMEDEVGYPGTPGDGTPDLSCPSCGFQAPGASPMSSTMSDPMAPGAQSDGLLVGDVCPNCQRATLISAGEAAQQEQAVEQMQGISPV